MDKYTTEIANIGKLKNKQNNNVENCELASEVDSNIYILFG